MQKLFSQFEDYMKKIDQRTRNEDYKRIDATEKNLADLKILQCDSKRIVIFYRFLLNEINKILNFFDFTEIFFKKDDIESQNSLLSSDKQREISFKVKTFIFFKF